MQNIKEEFNFQRMRSILEVRKHTCTLIKNTSNYKAHGSAVLVKIDNLYLMISAAHVFDDFEDIYILLDKGKFLFKPGGEIIKNIPQSTREKDKLDIAVLVLDKESIEEIEGQTRYSFLDQSNIQINHLIDYEDNYLIFGYPSSWSKKSKSRNSFHSRPFICFTNPIIVDEYKKFEREPFLSIILNYNRKKTINIKSQSLSYGPSLAGASGCGLWYLDNNDNNATPKLVGIMTDWPLSDSHKVIAIRIDTVTELLVNKYKINFPNTKLFGYK